MIDTHSARHRDFESAADSSGVTREASEVGSSLTLPHKPSSLLKKEGWRGLMREVSQYGGLVVTNYNQPEAVVLSFERYEALSRLAQGEEMRRVQQLNELRARFDKRLAVIKTPEGRQALDAFMEDPVVLDGQVRAGVDY
jgi:PHD/YefM family antitoxin component YafN of YafNO toxin-antitoxin module